MKVNVKTLKMVVGIVALTSWMIFFLGVFLTLLVEGFRTLNFRLVMLSVAVFFMDIFAGEHFYRRVVGWVER